MREGKQDKGGEERTEKRLVENGRKKISLIRRIKERGYTVGGRKLVRNRNPARSIRTVRNTAKVRILLAAAGQ